MNVSFTALGSALALALVLPIDASLADTIGPAPITRFERVDSHLFRGGQPDAKGFRYLRDLGIRTIINLRDDDSATAERQLVESLGMRYVSLPMKVGNFFSRSHSIPEEAIRQFFEVMDAAASLSGPREGGPAVQAAGPVFIHCRRGADRTGAMVAFYRIRHHGWTAARAYAEARDLGMRWWHNGLKRQIAIFAGTNPVPSDPRRASGRQ
jgi:protein tyrosine/serine phosphatase